MDIIQYCVGTDVEKDAFSKMASNENSSDWQNTQQVYTNTPIHENNPNFKKLLMEFVNLQFKTLEMEVTNIRQLHDGVMLIALTGIICNYFVPMNCYYLNPQTIDQKIHNIQLAFKNLAEAGMITTHWNAIDMVQKDDKMIARVLFDIYWYFKE